MRVPKSVLVALVTALVVMAGMTFLNSRAAQTTAAGTGGQTDRMFLSAAGGPVPTWDTYPAKWKDARQDSVFDTWREWNRECTSYAAWMLSSVNGYDMPWHDDAAAWGPRARGAGVTVNSTPAVGSIAWRASGHVAYVVKVEPGRVYVQDYNKHYDGRWDQRWDNVSAWTGFIHFKDLTPTPAPAPVQAAPQPAPLQVQPVNPGAGLQGGAGSVQGGSSANLQGSSPGLQGSGTQVQGGKTSRPGTTTGTSAGSGKAAGGAVTSPRTSTTTTKPAAKPSTPPPPAPPAPPAPPRTYTEQSGSHGSPTFTNPYNASGQGPMVPAMSSVQVQCRVYAPAIVSANPDGWWYRIATSPWNGAYYAVANTFWNGDTPGVTPYTHNTDWSVPVC
ncbi:MAG TPA: CHAP domain-containing protein [Actinomycetales bacterium]|nr:CHAP domain-containing protein [Actinomycetales bacterium]